MFLAFLEITIIALSYNETNLKIVDSFVVFPMFVIHSVVGPVVVVVRATVMMVMSRRRPVIAGVVVEK